MNKNYRRPLLSIAIFFLCVLPVSVHARRIGLQFGIGDWYSDEFHSSYSVGGGIIARPGPEWLELSVVYLRMPISVRTGEPRASTLKGKWLSSWQFAPNYVIPLTIEGIPAQLYSSVAYVLTEGSDHTTNGLGFGGGLEFLFQQSHIGLRFDAEDLMYHIPVPGADTSLQSDFLFSLRLVGAY